MSDGPAVPAVPEDPADLHALEYTCDRCRLVHWRPAGPAACDR